MKQPTPDGIPSILLKKCSQALIYPLQKILSVSVSEGKFPTIWKKSFVTPTYKQGDKFSVSNYRPICFMCPIASLLENIINTKLYSQVSRFISPKQHGFLPGKSVTTNLLELPDMVTKAFGINSQVDAIYLDLAKAFDTVDHNKLLNKLSYFGIKGTLLEWFASYLSGREHIILVNGNQSNPYKVTSGVAQGSRLGPLLFDLFINDLVEVVKHSEITLFADDCRISKQINNSQDSYDLQRDHERVIKWVKANELTINKDKFRTSLK